MFIDFASLNSVLNMQLFFLTYYTRIFSLYRSLVHVYITFTFCRNRYQPNLFCSLLSFARRLSTFDSLSAEKSVRPSLAEHQAALMRRGLPKQRPVPGVTHIVAVGAGKGGVGAILVSISLPRLIYSYPLYIFVLKKSITWRSQESRLWQ